jgi:two-component system copper resistance phosphate regulon response regulator CusR
MNILIVEDNKEILSLLQPLLRSEGFVVDVAEHGDDGLYKAKTNNYDIIILDIMLPGKDGRQICKEIRSSGKQVPIIMLSVKGEIGTKVDLFSIGADDYVVKPFSFVELLARIRALLRRPNTMKSDVLRIGDLVLDIGRHVVTRGKKIIRLTPKEFFLLEYLMRNQDRVLSRAAILEHVWDMDADPFTNTIETHILNIRKKLGGKAKRNIIENISGVGYKINS